MRYSLTHQNRHWTRRNVVWLSAVLLFVSTCLSCFQAMGAMALPDAPEVLQLVEQPAEVSPDCHSVEEVVEHCVLDEADCCADMTGPLKADKPLAELKLQLLDVALLYTEPLQTALSLKPSASSISFSPGYSGSSERIHLVQCCFLN